MIRIRLTKAFNFEMAHALPGHDGPCKHIHGHTYELFVTVTGEPIIDPRSPKFGMIMDFKDLKDLVKKAVIDDFDHGLVLNKNFLPSGLNHKDDLFKKMVLVDYHPTSENLVFHFAERIKMMLPETVKLHSLRLRETLTSYAEWFAEDNN